MQETSPGAGKVTIRLATPLDREVIYRVRHAVYAQELGQHATNADGRFIDSLDAYNHYIVALLGKELAGFVSITPPYAVSLPAQVAAVFALQDPEYYAGRYAETHVSREELVAGLRSVGIRQVVPGIANFILCHLPDDFPDATSVTLRCREHGLYLRNVGNMGARMGNRAIRVAVKDRVTNQRLVEILGRVVRRVVLPGPPNLGGRSSC
jgi:hypothetical protein